MKEKLFAEGIIKFLCGLILVFLLIFVPAGSLSFFHGWLYICLLFVPMFAAGIIMLFINPELLKKRLGVREKEKEQKFVIIASGIIFAASFILAGLNYRFSWFSLPDWIIYVSAAVFLLSYVLYAEVLRENTYLSRTVEVQKDQKVTDTGMYGVVRHPMYMTTLFLFLSSCLVLNSIYSFIVMLLYIPVIVVRIKNEEKVLAENLPGYKAYMKKVRYRLIRPVW